MSAFLPHVGRLCWGHTIASGDGWQSHVVLVRVASFVGHCCCFLLGSQRILHHHCIHRQLASIFSPAPIWSSKCCHCCCEYDWRSQSAVAALVSFGRHPYKFGEDFHSLWWRCFGQLFWNNASLGAISDPVRMVRNDPHSDPGYWWWIFTGSSYYRTVVGTRTLIN